jgi:hypothetical protein
MRSRINANVGCCTDRCLVYTKSSSSLKTLLGATARAAALGSIASRSKPPFRRIHYRYDASGRRTAALIAGYGMVYPIDVCICVLGTHIQGTFVINRCLLDAWGATRAARNFNEGPTR